MTGSCPPTPIGYAPGGGGDTLPDDVVALFSGDKPVFIQCGSGIPSGKGLTASWRNALEKCGVDGTKLFGYDRAGDTQSETSLPANQAGEIPYTGYYGDTYLRFTGFDTQHGTDLRRHSHPNRGHKRQGLLYSKQNLRQRSVCCWKE